MASDLRSDLYQLLPQCGRRPVLHFLSQGESLLMANSGPSAGLRLTSALTPKADIPRPNVRSWGYSGPFAVGWGNLGVLLTVTSSGNLPITLPQPCHNLAVRTRDLPVISPAELIAISNAVTHNPATALVRDKALGGGRVSLAWTRPFKAAWGASLGVGVVRYPAGQMRL